MKIFEALGKKGRDTVSGFSGTIMGTCAYATGSDQLLITPTVSDSGEYREGHWFDADRVQVNEDIPAMTFPSNATSER